MIIANQTTDALLIGNLVYGSTGFDEIEVADGGLAFGNDGNDGIQVGPGAKVFGGDGDDRIFVITFGEVYGGAGDDFISNAGGTVPGRYGGGPGADRITGAGVLWAGNDSDMDELNATGPADVCYAGSADSTTGCETRR